MKTKTPVLIGDLQERFDYQRDFELDMIKLVSNPDRFKSAKNILTKLYYELDYLMQSVAGYYASDTDIDILESHTHEVFDYVMNGNDNFKDSTFKNVYGPYLSVIDEFKYVKNGMLSTLGISKPEIASRFYVIDLESYLNKVVNEISDILYPKGSKNKEMQSKVNV